MRKYAVLVLVAILILAIGGCAPFSPAPPTKAILKGRVVVPEGAVRQVGGQALPGATVNVIDPVTGNIVATTTTDANGNYQVEVPPGGPYIIEAVKGSIKVLDVSPQVEAGETYPLGVADAYSTAVALVFQAKVEAGEDPAEIDLEEIEEDPKIGNLIEAIEEALAAGEDPTTTPEVTHLVDVIVTPPKPTTPTTPSTPVTPTPTPPTITLSPATGSSTVAQGGELTPVDITLSSNYNATGLKTFISLKKDNTAVNFNDVFESFNLKTDGDKPYNMVGAYSTFQYGPSGGYSVTAGVPQVTTITGKVKLTASEGTYTITTEIKDAGGKVLATATYTLEVASPTITLSPPTGSSTVAQGENLQESRITLSSNYNATGLKTVISLKKGDDAVNFDAVFESFNLKTDGDKPYNMVGAYSTFQYGPSGGYSVTAGVSQVTTVTGKVKPDALVGIYTIITEIKDASDKLLATATYTLEVTAST